MKTLTRMWWKEELEQNRTELFFLMTVAIYYLWIVIKHDILILWYTTVICRDGIHFSPLGSQIAVKEILKVLKEADWEPILYWMSMPNEFDEDSPYYMVRPDGKSTINASKVISRWKVKWAAKGITSKLWLLEVRFLFPSNTLVQINRGQNCVLIIFLVAFAVSKMKILSHD